MIGKHTRSLITRFNLDFNDDHFHRVDNYKCVTTCANIAIATLRSVILIRSFLIHINL